MPIQLVQNYAARLILGASHFQPATPLLRTLHWLPVSESLEHKVGWICYNIIAATAPSTSQNFFQSTPTLWNCALLPIHVNFRKDYKRKTHGYRSLSFYGPHFPLTTIVL